MQSKISIKHRLMLVLSLSVPTVQRYNVMSLPEEVSPIAKVPNQLVGTPLNTDVQLECYIEAFPSTINYWMKNREMLMNGKKHSITEERQGYRVSMTLIIRNVLRRDIGTYSCVATNSLGKINGTIRLYEIKLQTRAPTTTTTTTTTTTERTTESTIITYPTTPIIILTEVNVPLRDVHLNNYIPSVKPAPLEIVLTGRAASIQSPALIISLLLIINYFR